MIKTFKNADLREFFETGKSRRIDTKLHKRVKQRLDALNAATDLRALFLPGYELHKWEPANLNKWSISVSGPWRITFNWINNEAHNVDLEQPH